MTWIDKPRPLDPGGELAQSRREQKIELTEIGGLSGMRTIRSRLAAVRRLKGLVRGRSLTDAELDQVADPTDCRRTRIRLGVSPSSGSHGRQHARPQNGMHSHRRR